jgi:hypothetical protein
MSYECHITVPPPPAEADLVYLEGLAKNHGFKTSFIVGDPLLGDAKYFYMTGHDADLEKMQARMNALSREVQTLARVRVLRRKIELIVFDERTS